MGVRREDPRRIPRAVLGLEVPRQLVVVDLDPEVAQQAADEAGVLDLLDRAGYPEERLVVLAEALREGVHLRQPVAPDGGEPGPVAGDDQLRRVRELDQRVAPIEEDRLEHGWL